MCKVWAEEETINHILFEFPPAIQVWVLFGISTNQGYFYTQSVFANIDYLFQRIDHILQISILLGFFNWYIWKGEMIKYLMVLTETLEILYRWWKQKQLFGGTHNWIKGSQELRIQLIRTKKLMLLRVGLGDGATKMFPRKIKTCSQDKFGTTLQKVLMV